MIGSHSNFPTTWPIEPFAYPASKLFFTNMTRAHFLRTSVSGARHHFLRDSTSFSAPFDIISNINVSSWMLLSRSVLYASTDILRVKSSVWSSVSTLTLREARSWRDRSVICPARISLRIPRSGSWPSSPSEMWEWFVVPTGETDTCLYWVVSTALTSFHSLQDGCSKANSTYEELRETGGSWKKSHTRTIWIHQNGSGETRARWRSISSEARNSPPSMEISSIIRIEVFKNRFMRYSRSVMYSISSVVSLSRIPIPLQECIVIPPICVAAIPVEAVMAILILCSCAYWINRLIRYVFPLPAAPVRNTFCPIASMSKTSSCVMSMSVWKKKEKTIKKIS